MSDTIVAALIAAGGAILVALITLGRQWWLDRKTARANQIDDLFDEARQMLAEHRINEDRLKADLVEERADKRRIREDRDEWRRRAENCERLWDQLREAKERPT